MINSLKKSLFGLPIGLMMAICGHAATGPSSSESPYLTPVASGVEFTSLITVGDAVRKNNPASLADTVYRMVGIPDGLGAFDNGDGTITILANHELGSSQGIARAHGATGAFISKWRVRKADLKVLRGEDLIKKAHVYNFATNTWSPSTVSFGRFCSGDLAPLSALYNVNTDKGFSNGRVFLTGEENGPTGRAFVNFASGPLEGQSFEFPGIGMASWENIVANPKSQDNTIVIGTDDTNLGKVYVYGGAKGATGDALSSGLAGGLVRVIAIDGLSTELRTGTPADGTRFSLVSTADTAGTKFLRPEDGAWDTQNPNRFYFVTTDRFDQVKVGTGTQVGRPRLWRLTFDNIENPLLGGTVEALLDGTEAGQMFDNITVDASGKVFIQEDPGGQPYNAKIWSYDPATDGLSLVAQHDVARFGDISTAPTAPHNNDEESSGIIEVTDMFAGVAGYDTVANKYFLISDQAHSSLPDAELVQRGQLLFVKIPR
jgi:hypothetical protein